MSERLKEFGEGDPKETSQGLPVVTSATVLAIEQIYTERSGAWGNYLEEIFQRMQIENPNLIAFIQDAVIAPQPIQSRVPMFQAFVATIAILERQALANKLKEKFK